MRTPVWMVVSGVGGYGVSVAAGGPGGLVRWCVGADWNPGPEGPLTLRWSPHKSWLFSDQLLITLPHHRVTGHIRNNSFKCQKMTQHRLRAYL